MDTLGYIYEKPFINKTGRWDYINVEFQDVESFCEGTSKALNMFKHPDGDGRCIVIDTDGDKYIMDVTHITYDTPNHIIRILPRECKKIKPLS